MTKATAMSAERILAFWGRLPGHPDQEFHVWTERYARPDRRPWLSAAIPEVLVRDLLVQPLRASIPHRTHQTGQRPDRRAALPEVRLHREGQGDLRLRPPEEEAMGMKQSRRLLIGAAILIVAVATLGAGRPSGIERIYVVEGRDIVRPDGSAAFTIDRQSVVMGDPHDMGSLHRAIAAGAAALKATAPLTLTPDQEAKYHPDCPQYQTEAVLMTTEPTLDCTYGQPDCANWKTKDLYDCWAAATNCVRTRKLN